MLERSHCYVFHEDGSVYKGPIDSKDQATGSGVLKTPYFTYTGSF